MAEPSSANLRSIRATSSPSVCRNSSECQLSSSPSVTATSKLSGSTRRSSSNGGSRSDSESTRMSCGTLLPFPVRCSLFEEGANAFHRVFGGHEFVGVEAFDLIKSCQRPLPGAHCFLGYPQRCGRELPHSLASVIDDFREFVFRQRFVGKADAHGLFAGDLATGEDKFCRVFLTHEFREHCASNGRKTAERNFREPPVGRVRGEHHVAHRS